MQERSVILPARLREVRVDSGSSATAPHLVEAKPSMADGQETFDRIMASLGEAVTQMRQQQQVQVGQCQTAIVELAVAIASRFLHDKVRAGEFPLEILVQQALERLDVRQAVQVFLHPDDVKILQQRLEQSKEGWPAGDIRFVADAGVRRGGCRVQAGDNGLFADLEMLLTELRQQLLEHPSEPSLPSSPVNHPR